jgi:hypothetical protein
VIGTTSGGVGVSTDNSTGDVVVNCICSVGEVTADNSTGVEVANFICSVGEVIPPPGTAGRLHPASAATRRIRISDLRVMIILYTRLEIESNECNS